MKVLIIEDEPIAAKRLKTMLSEIDREIEIIEVLDSVEAARDFFSMAPTIDLMFMDIELGDGQSFEIFEYSGTDLPVIFITAYREHSLKAFKVNSVDYLVKPLTKTDLVAAIRKFKKHFRRTNEQEGADITHLIKKLKGIKEGKTRFLARAGTRLISVSSDQIAYFYTRDKLQFIKTVKNEDLIIDKRLDEIEKEADADVFFRANRQFILNYNHIEKVHSWFSGKIKVQVIPAAYEDIIVSRLRAADFKKWLGE